jgi:hypothetical protein
MSPNVEKDEQVIKEGSTINWRASKRSTIALRETEQSNGQFPHPPKEKK